MPQSEPKQIFDAGTAEPDWKGFYKIGGTTALIALAVVFAEIGIAFLPGTGLASPPHGTITVLDWFALFQNNWFLGLRNLGLLNIVGAALLAPTFLGLYAALKRGDEAFSAFAAILFFVGIAVYLAGNRAFPMLSLSGQYVSAATDAQRSQFIAAGQAILAEGQSRLGIVLIDSAGLLMSAVMLRGKAFSRATAYAGILGNCLMIVVEVVVALAHTVRGAGLVIAICGGLSIVSWYFLVGRSLLQLGRR